MMGTQQENMKETKGELILYTSEDGLTQIQLWTVGGTVWLTQAQMADLFQTSPQAITQLVRSIYGDGELTENSTCKEFSQVRTEGGRQVLRSLKFYNLEMILAVGYRVRSPRGVQFRGWATTVLKEYLVKGFSMDDQRLKQEKRWDYFDELLERIRDIRASEKRFYQKIRDLYATAVDYDKASEQAQAFFKKVQNKMLWAVTGKTAAELVAGRSDSDAPNMGLTSWKGSIVRKGDVGVAKNYLKKEEIDELNRIVVMYLDYAEDQVKRRRTITMDEWSRRLDAFLDFNEQELLTHAGKVRIEVAKKLALERFEEFDLKRKALEAQAADEEDLEKLERIAEATKKNKGKEV